MHISSRTGKLFNVEFVIPSVKPATANSKLPPNHSTSRLVCPFGHGWKHCSQIINPWPHSQELRQYQDQNQTRVPNCSLVEAWLHSHLGIRAATNSNFIVSGVCQVYVLYAINFRTVRAVSHTHTHTHTHHTHTHTHLWVQIAPRS